MKFAPISFSVMALPLLATAIALPGGGGSPPSCGAGTGDLTCCNSVQAVDSLTHPLTVLLGLLGINVGTLEGLVGVTCNPIVGAITCTQETVCCTNDNFSGLVAIGCTNVNL